jgi:hypothetical protein
MFERLTAGQINVSRSLLHTIETTTIAINHGNLGWINGINSNRAEGEIQDRSCELYLRRSCGKFQEAFQDEQRTLSLNTRAMMIVHEQ